MKIRNRGGWLSSSAGETRNRSILAYLGRSTGWTSSTANQLAEFDQWFDRIDDPWQRSQAAVRSFWTRPA